MKGTITTWFENKQYGFITADADNVSRFFHASNYVGVPKIGTRVEFALGDPTKIGKQKQCINVAPIESEGVGGGQ